MFHMPHQIGICVSNPVFLKLLYTYILLSVLLTEYC